MYPVKQRKLTEINKLIFNCFGKLPGRNKNVSIYSFPHSLKYYIHTFQLMDFMKWKNRFIHESQRIRISAIVLLFLKQMFERINILIVRYNQYIAIQFLDDKHQVSWFIMCVLYTMPSHDQSCVCTIQLFIGL